jgi:hypothetical protein
MHNWIWFVFLALVLIKLPIAAVMLWLPFRSDAAMESPPAAEPDATGEDEGGSKTLPHDFRHHRRPRGPLRGPGSRRGPHGGGVGGPSPAPTSSPARIRATRRSGASRNATRH